MIVERAAIGDRLRLYEDQTNVGEFTNQRMGLKGIPVSTTYPKVTMEGFESR